MELNTPHETDLVQIIDKIRLHLLAGEVAVGPKSLSALASVASMGLSPAGTQFVVPDGIVAMVESKGITIDELQRHLDGGTGAGVTLR